ncbi:site-specific integrase [Desulfovibrio sp. OttesenSCG-928-G11]|nr:site-specific integrase [Desulfovibrio sp. OttesenSCG-928-G11]
MATVTIQRRKKKDGTPSYPVYFVDPHSGKKKYHATFRTLKEAQLATHTLRDVIDKGTAPEPRRKARGMTLGEIGELCRVTWQERAAGGELRPATLRGYLELLNGLLRFERTQIMADGAKLIHPPLRTFKIALLTPDLIKSIRAGMAAATSAVTSNRRLFIMKELCARAVKEGEIAANPSQGISYLSEKKHQRTAFLTPDELDRLLEQAAVNRAGYLVPAILLGAEHGCSLQEITSLKWTDIDFHFDGTGRITFFRTKNSRRRTMRLMPRTREALLHWRERLVTERTKMGLMETRPTGHVCCRFDGRPISSIKHAWEKARAGAGLEDFHFHDLRHTFCSSIVMAGGDIKMACDMIGHSDIKMTSRYTHLSQLAHERMQSRLAAYYDGAQP